MLSGGSARETKEVEQEVPQERDVPGGWGAMAGSTHHGGWGAKTTKELGGAARQEIGGTWTRAQATGQERKELMEETFRRQAP